MKCHKRLIYEQFVQVSGLCSPQFLRYIWNVSRTFVELCMETPYWCTVLVHQCGLRKSRKISGVHFFYNRPKCINLEIMKSQKQEMKTLTTYQMIDDTKNGATKIRLLTLITSYFDLVLRWTRGHISTWIRRWTTRNWTAQQHNGDTHQIKGDCLTRLWKGSIPGLLVRREKFKSVIST